MNLAAFLAKRFQNSPLTPLLAIIAFLLGAISFVITPKEEEPQIDVTMVDVITAFPGADAQTVEKQVTTRMEQALSKMRGIKQITSTSHDNTSISTVQFEVGIKRDEALIRLYETLKTHTDLFQAAQGVSTPTIKVRGIDDVPIVTLTLFSKNNQRGSATLLEVGQSLEGEIKRLNGVAEVTTIGGSPRRLVVELDPQRMREHVVTCDQITQAISQSHQGGFVGNLTNNNQITSLEMHSFLSSIKDLQHLVISTDKKRPLYLSEVSQLIEKPLHATSYVTHYDNRTGETFPAITLSITKKQGENATSIADHVLSHLKQISHTLIPHDVEILVTRNYGQTASDKTQTLLHKLVIATLSVVALIFLFLGRRESLIVGISVLLTLTATLFASWAWGFTLNRVSLFALIFSIGILVDDAIVVIENIHRHKHLNPHLPLSSIVPTAVGEVGAPTILATFTVIAALMPMAFITGLMGPYMRPIPINASMGMLLSLLIAFTLTPWLAIRLLDAKGSALLPIVKHTHTSFERIFSWLLDPNKGPAHRRFFLGGVTVLLILSLCLPVFKGVILKMLPFDNKSEIQVVVDMPEGTALEKTSQVTSDMATALKPVYGVQHFQSYVGTPSAVTFNGLVRQYYLRTAPHLADIQITLTEKHARTQQSHSIAKDIRQRLMPIARAHDAKVKVVEVPPGPPVLAPIVAEIYGPRTQERNILTQEVENVFMASPELVDIDTSLTHKAPKIHLMVDREKAGMRGVTQDSIYRTLRLATLGQDIVFLKEPFKYPRAVHVRLPWHSQGNLQQFLELGIMSSSNQIVSLKEFISPVNSHINQALYRKNFIPVSYIVADVAGTLDSPLYGIFDIRHKVTAINSPQTGSLEERFASAPNNPFAGYSLKWGGEWQITYETFRDMGIAYAAGLILIYLLVVAHFSSYSTPLIIMAPIPLTIIGVLPGHALLGAQFTATSMIGMIALAGIIVRNSILLVDFIIFKKKAGAALHRAVIDATIVRFQPILLTALAAMVGSLFILDDPIFKGLAISIIFGALVSTALTLFVIPLLYYLVHKKQDDEIGKLPTPQNA